jgi:hypothetical protein
MNVVEFNKKKIWNLLFVKGLCRWKISELLENTMENLFKKYNMLFTKLFFIKENI